MAEIEVTPTRSSMLTNLKHNDETNEMIITFQGGSEYKYDGVSKETFDALCNADSIGKHFAMHIKDKFKTTKL